MSAPGLRVSVPGLRARLPAPGAVLLALLPWAAALAVYALADSYLGLGTSVLVMILFALSLDLALGHAGIVTLGHAAFYGIGAYAAGACALHLSTDPLLGLLLASLVAGVFGALSGMLILHTAGMTLMMLTLAVAALVAEAANQFYALTGGDDGLQLPRLDPVLGLFRFDLWGQTAYLYALAVLLLWFLLSRRVFRSPFGRSLDGIRQSPRRMRAVGTPVWWRLVAAYALSATMAGSAGALAAQTTRSVGLGSLGLLMSGTVLVVLVLGGMRRLYGAFVGAVVYLVLQDVAAEVDPFRWMFAIGALLIVVVLFLENGLMGLADMAGRALGRGGVSRDG
ncbi:branched-chain amino acid ABC transporter permease [Roseomonas sp. BN140053]|uniref:branched-chain amino acid ABC transporter permease n=1 Tax=Roseomonas sp. BN140053 TaxID=3391898 RepID=UPI0039E7EF6B